MEQTNEMNDEAVSPVIATILMVAITVVLAGVLYVWASGLADQDADFSLLNYNVADVRDSALSDNVNDALVALTWVNGASPDGGALWRDMKVILIDANQNELECEENADNTNYNADGTAAAEADQKSPDTKCIIEEKTKAGDGIWSPEETIWIRENGVDVGGCTGDNGGQNCAVSVKVVATSADGKVTVVGGSSKSVTISPN